MCAWWTARTIQAHEHERRISSERGLRFLMPIRLAATLRSSSRRVRFGSPFKARAARRRCSSTRRGARNPMQSVEGPRC